MEKLLNRMNAWLKKARQIPFIGPMADDLAAMAQLLGDWAGGLYRDLPRGTVLALIVAVCYLLFPVDLIVDVVPFAGFLDDAAILGLILQLGLAQDLVRYRGWKEDLIRRQTEILLDHQTARILALVGSRRLAAAFLTGEKELRMLLCSSEQHTPPLHCRAVTEPIDLSLLEPIGATDWEELGRFYTAVFRDPRIPWSALGPRPFMPEYDPQAQSDDFTTDEIPL